MRCGVFKYIRVQKNTNARVEMLIAAVLSIVLFAVVIACGRRKPAPLVCCAHDAEAVYVDAFPHPMHFSSLSREPLRNASFYDGKKMC